MKRWWTLSQPHLQIENLTSYKVPPGLLQVHKKPGHGLSESEGSTMALLQLARSCPE